MLFMAVEENLTKIPFCVNIWVDVNSTTTERTCGVFGCVVDTVTPQDKPRKIACRAVLVDKVPFHSWFTGLSAGSFVDYGVVKNQTWFRRGLRGDNVVFPIDNDRE